MPSHFYALVLTRSTNQLPVVCPRFSKQDDEIYPLKAEEPGASQLAQKTGPHFQEGSCRNQARFAATRVQTYVVTSSTANLNNFSRHLDTKFSISDVERSGSRLYRRRFSRPNASCRSLEEICKFCIRFMTLLALFCRAMRVAFDGCLLTPSSCTPGSPILRLLQS